jgi:hypothetical protein
MGTPSFTRVFFDIIPLNSSETNNVLKNNRSDVYAFSNHYLMAIIRVVEMY